MRLKPLHIVSLFLILPALLIVSCKKDMQKPLSELLIGKWKLDSTYMSIHYNGFDTIFGLSNQYIRTIEFKSDLTFKDTSSTTAVLKGGYTLTDSILKYGEPWNQSVKVIQLDDVQLKLQFTNDEYSKTYNWYSRVF